MDKPHIGFEITSYLYDNLEQNISRDLSAKRLKLKFIKVEPQIMNVVEWAIPAAISVYLLKAYFDGFLKEAGKDHYNLLKHTIKRLLSSAKEMKFITVVSSASPNKLDKTNVQSKGISIYAQLSSGRVIRMFFNENLPLQIWLDKFDELGFLLMVEYGLEFDDEISNRLNTLPPGEDELICLINEKSYDLQFFTQAQLLEIRRAKNNN